MDVRHRTSLGAIRSVHHYTPEDPRPGSCRVLAGTKGSAGVHRYVQLLGDVRVRQPAGEVAQQHHLTVRQRFHEAASTPVRGETIPGGDHRAGEILAAALGQARHDRPHLGHIPERASQPFALRQPESRDRHFPGGTIVAGQTRDRRAAKQPLHSCGDIAVSGLPAVDPVLRLVDFARRQGDVHPHRLVHRRRVPGR